DALAARVGEELAAVAEEAAARDDEGEDRGRAAALHRDDARAPLRELLEHGALARVRDLGDHVLDRLAAPPLDLACDDLRARDGELVALAAHLLDEHADLHLAPRGDLEDLGALGGLDADRHVAERLAPQPLADLARGDELPFAARERRVVDREAY